MGNAGGKLSQQRHAARGQYGLLVLDAFSSDAIPTHLLTREAFTLYLDKLADGGLLVLHTSNQFLDLRPVVADLAQDAKLTGLVRTDLEASDDPQDQGKESSQWMVLARSAAQLDALQQDKRWQPLPQRSAPQVWTDDYSNILGVFKWQ